MFEFKKTCQLKKYKGNAQRPLISPLPDHGAPVAPRTEPATDPATCDEEMPAVVPTGPVRAKSAAPSPFERLSDENPAPQTNPTESLDAALEEGGLTVTRPERSMVRTLQQLVICATKTAARRSRARAAACCVPTTS